jgi:hypothetical protein
MAEESFKDTKWILKSKHRKMPERWLECDPVAISFFSDSFLDFLKRGKYFSKSFCNGCELKIYTGSDPRDNPETYLHWYCNNNDLSDLEDEIDRELKLVLEDHYDKQSVKFLMKESGTSLGLEEFTRRLTLLQLNEPQGQGQMLGNGRPDSF